MRSAQTTPCAPWRAQPPPAWRRHARLGGGVSWRECHGLDAGSGGQAGAFTAPAPIFPRRSRRGRYDSAPAVPQEKGDEALALAQLFSRCLHVARRACGDHGAVDLVQCRGGVLSSVRVTMEWGSPCCAIGGADPRGLRPACRRHCYVVHVGTPPRLPATLPQWRYRRRHRAWSTVHAAPGARDERVADLGASRRRVPRPGLRRRTPVLRRLRAGACRAPALSQACPVSRGGHIACRRTPTAVRRAVAGASPVSVDLMSCRGDSTMKRSHWMLLIGAVVLALVLVLVIPPW